MGDKSSAFVYSLNVKVTIQSGYCRKFHPASRLRLSRSRNGGGEKNAGSETRTRTLSPAVDFESTASANSAIPAHTAGECEYYRADESTDKVGRVIFITLII